MKKFKIGQIRAIVAGAGYGGESLAEELLKDRHIGIVPVAFVDDDDAKLNQIIHGIPILGKIDDAVKIARERKIDYIIVCLPLNVIRDKIKALSRYFKHIMIVPDSEVFPTAWTYPIDMNGRLGVELRNQLMLRGPRLAKKLLEFVLAAVAIVCLFPIFILLAVLIKITSKGPIYYSAERLGLNGKKIKVLKFRTMYNDAHTKLEQMLEANPELRKEWQEKFKLNDDPRITTLGRFLRKTSLDELPQFVNVIKGEMAVIGPRPIVEKEKIYYGENYELINRVKPGITGYWQVSGRSETNYNQRVRMDIYYIMNWSVWLDVYILLKTVKEVLYCKGAF
jgi:Undecaprenyl-phosphate galactose phosphotransferase WbaP